MTWRPYLAANDGADLIVRRGGRTGDVGVTVAKTTGAVEVKAGWSNSWASHGGIVNRTSQPSWAFGDTQQKENEENS